MADLTKDAVRWWLRRILGALPEAEKKEMDDALFGLVIAQPEYRQADTLLCYCSTPTEPDTRRLIRHAINGGKQVALPRCTEQKGEMVFYRITSLDDLQTGRYSLLEPDPARCELLSEIPEDALCIVPGLGFDPAGYRIGQGGGYYDRFLSGYTGVSAGLCYEACLLPRLPHEPHDRRVDVLLTEKRRFSAPLSI